MNLRLISALALVLAAPAAAQQSLPTPQPTEQVPEEGLSGAVSDDSDWQDLGIAIPAFATDADVPTQTSAGSTAAANSAACPFTAVPVATGTSSRRSRSGKEPVPADRIA